MAGYLWSHIKFQLNINGHVQRDGPYEGRHGGYGPLGYTKGGGQAPLLIHEGGNGHIAPLDPPVQVWMED